LSDHESKSLHISPLSTCVRSVTTTALFWVQLSALFDIGASALVASCGPLPPMALEVAIWFLDLVVRLCEED
jgi:hypothetical protein